MAVVNYAEKWNKELIETIIDNSYVSPFITTNVKWLDAKTFHFTTMTVDGYKNHGLNGGWNRVEFEQADHPYTLAHDRDVEFFVDKRNVDESNQTASVQNISQTFTMTQATPEIDAHFFSKVAATAIDEGLAKQTAISDYTFSNVVPNLRDVIGNVRRYRNKGLVLYVTPAIMDLLSGATDFQRTIEVTKIVNNGAAIDTRITALDGVPIVEVIEEERFYTAFDFTAGFEAAVGSYKINVLVCTPLTAKIVPKISSIYMYAPGQHTEGDGYLYQNRAFWDTFIFPNGKGGKIDSIYVDYDTTAVTEEDDG